MPVYMLFIREDRVLDPLALDVYSHMTRVGPRDPHLTPRVIYGEIEPIEGAAPDGVVMLEFPSAECARAWYNSSSYQAALPYRKLAANYRAFLVHGADESNLHESAARATCADLSLVDVSLSRQRA